MKSILNNPKVERLITLVEESTRSSKEGVKRFIEPAQGTLSRAVSKRHHIIFGRRGSGKSSLLRKAAADLTVDRRPIAYVDLEIFKGHTYPDVLISILVSTLKEFEQWLNTAAVNPANKTSFWQKLFGTKPARPAYRRTDVNSLAADIHTRIDDLKAELYSSDAVPTKTVTKRAQEHSEETAIQGEAKLHVASIAAKTADTSKIEDQQEIQREYQHSKIEFLHQHILEYQELFRRLQEICGGDSYLFLDDLYHIRTTDQPYVVDYFHRIAKGSGLWLKVGTIRHRSKWYIHGDPPIGVKLGDDADSIDLNLTLEKYSLTKEFLSKILRSFSQDCGIEVSDILNEGAIDRLVLASGGVARDFLAIFRKAVTVARERGDDSRGPKIGSEDVNRAAGEHEESKREELKRDVVEDQLEIEEQFEKIVNFCIEEAQANLFLIDKAASGKEVSLIQQLVDLRLIHLASSRITVSKEPGRIYEAYMLDVSQYAGSRARRNFEIVPFWKPGAANLRRVKLIYTIQ
jgi:Cdc6-like AAA superfamily ATPase